MRRLGLVLLLLPATTLAQGQDSQTWERDLQVITTLIEGGFDNANQSYFDFRGKYDIKHRRLHIDVESVDLPEIGDDVFIVTGYWDNDPDVAASSEVWSFSADAGTESVRMRAWPLDRDGGNAFGALATRSSCDFLWRREASQFRATREQACDTPLPTELILSDRQLWMDLGGDAGDYQLHRVRAFKCYADVPAVSGGRDEPYERYGEFGLHDQGGSVWFTSKEGRELGISLFLVDWPINNYEGVFTRDSFVLYVSEKIDGERKEHGYAFTVHDADRIGLNLKWILVLCYMKSNRDETPYM